jgi:hypothetical protein
VLQHLYIHNGPNSGKKRTEDVLYDSPSSFEAFYVTLLLPIVHLQDPSVKSSVSPKSLTLALISHVFGARLGADSTQPIKIEALSRKLKLVRGAFRNERKIRGAFIFLGALLYF